MNACHPQDNIGALDFDALCNQLGAIEAQCAWGSRALELISSPQDSDDKWPDSHRPEWQELSPEAQRTCFCQSQITDATMGCAACLYSHGITMLAKLYETLYSFEMIQQYCDVSLPITQTFAEFSGATYESRDPEEDENSYSGEDSGEDESPYTASTEPYLGTLTDVSRYYAMSVTRSDAYDIAVPTPVSGGDVTYTSTRISDGQIVPTAQAEKEASEEGPGEAGASSISTSTSSTSRFGDSFTPSSTSSVSGTRSLGIATPSTSQSSTGDDRDAIQDVEGCYPRNASGYLDFNAPCNQEQAILAQCSYGSRALKIMARPFGRGESPEFNNPKWQKMSPEAERTCLCQSQILDTGIGCLRCRKAHQLWLQNERMAEYERAEIQKYCDTDYTITQSFNEFSSDFNHDFFFDDDGSLWSYTAAEVITSTDVSLYYTLSVTRSDAYDIAMPTPAVSGGNVIYTSTRTFGGQIVPTARDVKDPRSPIIDSGAAAMHVGAAGLLAIAALAVVSF